MTSRLASDPSVFMQNKLSLFVNSIGSRIYLTFIPFSFNFASFDAQHHSCDYIQYVAAAAASLTTDETIVREA